jgi:hypothetical protein
MNRFTSKVLAAGLAVSLMGSVAFAQTDHNQMLNSVRVGLDSIQVDTSKLDMLNDDQLGQLTLILDADKTKEEKARSAKVIIDGAVMPTMVDMSSPEAVRLKTELKTNLDRVGLSYNLDALNLDQINQLTAVFVNAATMPDADVKAKQAAEAAYNSFASPAATTTADSNQGLEQQQAEVSLKLAALGITPPSALTQEQVAKLTGVFNGSMEKEADQKAAAMVILGM